MQFARMMYGADLPLALASAIRPSICAPEGRTLVAADLSSIEYVVLAWLAGSQSMLDTYASGKDAYKAFATHVYGRPYDEIDKAMRTACKAPVLGAGYGLSGPGLKAYAENMGIVLSDEDAERLVVIYRTTYPDVVDMWWNVTTAMQAAIKAPDAESAAARCGFKMVNGNLSVRLPSGRIFWYRRPQLKRNEISYLDANGNRSVTWHGKITENLVQAVARDVLVNGLLEADQCGLYVVGHVHDEILVECAESKGDEVLKMLVHCMTKRPSWAPDLPLRADGWVARRYHKE